MSTWKDFLSKVYKSKFTQQSAKVGAEALSAITEIVGSIASWFAPGLVREIKNMIGTGVGDLTYGQMYDRIITKLQPYINQLDTDSLQELTDTLAASANYAKSGLTRQVIDTARSKANKAAKEANLKKDELIARANKLANDIDSFTLSPTVSKQSKMAKEYRDIVYQANNLESDIKKGLNR